MFDARRAAPLTVAIVGYQDAGKTLLVEGLVREAARSELSVAVVKHDGHADDVRWPDWEKSGSDTVRMAAAGARWTMVASASGYLVHDWLATDLTVEDWLQALESSVSSFCERRPDVILVEGAKRSRLPKVAVVRSAEDLARLTASGVLHIVAVAMPLVPSAEESLRTTTSDIPIFGPDDVQALLQHLLNLATPD